MANRDFLEGQIHDHAERAAVAAGQKLAGLVPESSYVGELLKLDYNAAEVLVHDSHRQATGGIPLGCFLLASRLPGDGAINPADEDAALILLRVTGVTKLPNAIEMDFSRFQAGQRASDTADTWDAQGKTDQFTLHQLRFAGVRCRVLGTYHMKAGTANSWALGFGSDISNFYSGRGLKVFKPQGQALDTIVNFSRPILLDAHPLAGQRVRLGRVRYASSERNAAGVTVNVDPTDLIARRTALFGMSRTGKSNTTKMISAAVFRLRANNARRGRIGQLIFDVNGEYANDNPQDRGCLRQVHTTIQGGAAADVVTYGAAPHPNDPERRIIKINFYGADPANPADPRSWQDAVAVNAALEPLLVGKQAIDEALAREDSKYIRSFRDTSLAPPADTSPGEIIRYRRLLAIYRAILNAAGFTPPAALRQISLRNLFSAAFLDVMASPTSRSSKADEYRAAAQILRLPTPTLDQLRDAFSALRSFLSDKTSGYPAFNQNYQQENDGRSWDDDRPKGLLTIFEYQAGVRTFRSCLALHHATAVSDYAELIATDLVEGRLVIVDQSMGDPEMNRSAADRIMWAVFNRQKARFVNPVVENNEIQPLPDVIVYAEEAHNLLPASETGDLRKIWSRVAKEGSKYRIGLVYATQEPSSLQSNILKNTDNWFVAHLNNTDEVKELRKYYDFDDFAESITQAPDPGFIRMRTLSNPYIVPIQVDPFQVGGPHAVP